MCVHHDPRWTNACREERAEVPRSKEAANFCDWFKPRPGAFQPVGAATQAARDALAVLFGEPESTTAVDASVPSRSALDDLFSKDGKNKT
jgi:hypothetical protein